MRFRTIKPDEMKNFYLLIVTIFTIPLLMGCEEYLNDPLIDKETGDDINPIIVDFDNNQLIFRN